MSFEKNSDCDSLDLFTPEELTESERAWQAWLSGEDEGTSLEAMRKQEVVPSV
jgi:hypothetical protein